MKIENPFVTNLDLLIPTAAIARNPDKIQFIKEAMTKGEVRPATEAETRELLKNHTHPGCDLICLSGAEPFLAFRKRPEDSQSHRELYLSAKEITGKFQWFAVMPL